MNIVITGASGFVGLSLCEKLKKTNNTKALCNLCDEGLHNDVLWVKSDVSDYEDIKKICIIHKPEIIVHCAGIAHQKIGNINSEKYIQVNSLATENLAKAAIAANPNVHFIFLSSISVYGEDNIKVAVSEDYECKPSSDYAFSKLDAEKRLLNLYDTGELKKLDILRLAPVYDSVWSLNLDRRVFAPKKIAFIQFGSGEQKMSAVSRKNLVDFIDYRLKQEEEHLSDESVCNIFNVCDEKPYKFVEMIRVFKQSEYHPDRLVVRAPLSIVWIATRLAGLIIRNKRKWLHSCYDKLAYSLVFDNKRMLGTGFKPKHNLVSVFLDEVKESP